jgi:REP element-mobilizing transposase RayT
MTPARNVLVNPTATALYHCISRCVRRAFLCGAENSHRKQWIEDRLKELSGIFAIDVCGFSVLDNHLHVLLRLDLARAKLWSPEEIVRR